MKRSTEQALIRLAKGGDGQAMEALIRAHQEALFAFILRMSGRPHLAEDIVQEAFVRVLRNLDRFDPRFRFSTWLFTIAKRLYVNAVQKQRPAYDTDTVGVQEGSGESPARLYHLGLALGQTGETALAVETLRKAVGDDSFPQAAAANAELARLEAL